MEDASSVPTAAYETSKEIPIHGPATEDAPEWAMVELNGELLAPSEYPSKESSLNVLGSDSRVELGRLQLGSDSTPTMILGSHQLKGKVETLKEPFTVLEKVHNENQELVGYQIKGVIRQKLIFNQYPKVIMR